MNKKSYALILITIFFTSSCTGPVNRSNSSIQIRNKGSFFSKAQINKLSKIIKDKQLIFLGENHEAMSSNRSATEEILASIIKLNHNKGNTCLFIEAPYIYNDLLENFLDKKITFEELLLNIPEPFHKMFSQKILNMHLNKTISLFFMDLNGSNSMKERNDHMFNFTDKVSKSTNCYKSTFINGYKHLTDHTSPKGQAVKGLPKYFNNKSSLNLIFTPSYCQHLSTEIHATMPSYFRKKIDNPRHQSFSEDWDTFDQFIIVPVNNNCSKK